MRIDAYNHFLPKPFFDEMLKLAGDLKDLGKRIREVPSLYDLDLRRRIVDQFTDYAQILSLPGPSLESFVPPDKVEELARIGNDGLAELVLRHPQQFRGFVAQAPLTAADAGVRECERAIHDLGALGVQIYTNVGGKPLDRPQFAPFFAAMDRLGKPIWIHPIRGANLPDYIDEDRSLYEIWWTFGWSYETAACMARLIFSKIIDKYPNLKIIVHHFGGIVPMLEGRIGPGWDQLGARTTDEDYAALRRSLKKRPLDYFKNDFYADTAVFGADAATACGLAFFPLDKIVFASDCPFDPERGPGYIRETIRIIDALELDQSARDKIYYKNLEALTGASFARAG